MGRAFKSSVAKAMIGFWMASRVLAAPGARPAADAATCTLAKEYTLLRAKKESRAPGVFDPELDGYNGRLSVVLHQLGDALGKPSFTWDAIAGLLGKPDAILKAGESRSGIVVPAGEVYLVYFWRGWHDYLYFVSRKGTIQQADWYYAYE